MKTLLNVFCLTSLLASLNLHAQVLANSDDFSSAIPQKWQAISNPPQIPAGTGALNISDGVLKYYNVEPKAKDAAAYSWMPSVGPTNSNWSVDVNVNFSGVTLTSVGQYANLNLGVAFSSHSMTVAIDQYLTLIDSTPTLVRGFETYVDSEMTPLATDTASGLTQGTLRLQYDHTLGTLTAYFSDPSYKSGDLQAVGTVNVMSLWSMTASDTFNIFLVGSSGAKDAAAGPAITAGESYFDNFTSSGLEARTSPVPEPSTYAAILGALALGFALYRRR